MKSNKENIESFSSTNIEFILLSVAFISLLNETLGFHLKGILGFLFFYFLAIFFKLSAKNQSNYKPNFNNKYIKYFYILVIFYLLSLIANSFFFGRGISDWRFLSTPIITLLSIHFARNYLVKTSYFIRFFNLLILVTGIQSIIAFFILINNIGIARSEDIVLFNLLVIGGPSSFALKAMVMPFFLWFIYKFNHGRRKLINLIFILFVILSVSVSTYATSIFFIIISAFLFTFYIIIFPFSYKRSLLNFLFAGMLFYSLIIIYDLTYDMPIFRGFYYRFENVILDPTSGGYSGLDRSESRWDKNLLSIKEFNDSPVFGNNNGLVRVNNKLGGHSSFFDSLGAYGIFGGAGALILLNILVFTLMLKQYKDLRNYQNISVLITISLYIIGGVINPFWEGYQPAQIFLIFIPSLINNERSKHENKIKQKNPYL